MKPFTFRLAAGSAAAAVAALSFGLFMPVANSQVQATPSYQPIGVAAAGSGSMAWFHDPSTGRAVACQWGAPGAAGIQCVAARLP